MTITRGSGRAVGAMLFVQLMGLSLPFVLIMPIASANFLESAAHASGAVRLSVFLLFANAILTVFISLKIFQLLRKRGFYATAWLAILAVTWLLLQLVDNAHILAMLTLSQRFTESAPNPSVAALADMFRGTRRFIHYSELLIIDLWIGLFYGTLFHFRLIPRPLAFFGLAAVVAHAASITLPVLVGYPSVQQLGISLAFSHISIAGWLLARGFSGEKSPVNLD